MIEKLQVKDLINVGVFTALYFVCFFAVGMIGYIPVFMILLPLICPIVAGIPFMLFLTKVKKFGMITIMGTILGLLMLLTGHVWTVAVAGFSFGLIGDLIVKSGGYKSVKHSIIGYIFFSEWFIGAMAPLFFMRESYFKTIREGYGDTYADTLLSVTPNWVLGVMILLIVVGAIIGSLLGKAALKKHFKRAGIV